MLSSPPRPTSPPGNGVSLVSGFGTRGKVRSLGLGTGTALQGGRQHDVQTPAPFAGGGGVLTVALSWGDSAWGRGRALLRASARDKPALAALKPLSLGRAQLGGARLTFCGALMTPRL